MTDLERAILHIKTRADAWAVKEIEKALSQEPNIDMESEEIKILQKRSYLEGFHEALKMSVKQEPCDDAVSRDAVIEICNEEWDSDLLVERIEHLPSVTQKSVLDKIRAEIRKKMAFNSFNEGYVLYDDITKVFDKYKAESEGK